MLSIEPIPTGGDYHAYLLTEYYLGEENPGRWAGNGAQALGLAGEVDEQTFARLLDGFDRGGKPLVQNAGVRAGKWAHAPGWDLSFSAPKDVSVLWAVAAPETRQRIRSCHEAAVTEALGYLEAAAGQGRQKAQRGRGVARTPGSLVVATFGHAASREKDPQIHTHCVTFNVVVRPDGTTGAADSRPLYRHKMAAGAVYRATLAAALTRDLGLKLTAEKHGFGVAGVPKELSRDFSKRRGQIEQALAARNAHSAQAAAAAAKATRKAKTKGHAAGLFAQWREAAHHLGVTAEAVDKLFGQAEPRSAKRRERLVAQAVTRSAAALLDHNSYFGEKELVRTAANTLRGGAASGAEVRRQVTAWLVGPDVVPLGTRRGEDQYTTRTVIGQEKALLADAEKSAARREHAVSPRSLAKALKAFPDRGVSPDDADRNKGQRAAVEAVTQASGLTVLSGIAGAGKTTVLRTCRELWERSGYRVTGMALGGVAAKRLEQQSGIESETLAMRLLQLEGKGVAGATWHHLKQVVKTGVNELHRDVHLPVYRLNSFTLDKKTVVVLDEAGMVGTAELGRLLRAVVAAGAKLVLAGDVKQLQPIGAGSPLDRIERTYGAASLTHITRQKLDPDDRLPTWRRDAVKLFSDGAAAAALRLYADRGYVSVEANLDGAQKKLVAAWAAGGGLARPDENLILAGTNAAVRTLNALCQKERLRTAGARQRLKAVELDGEQFHEGDRVLFTKKSRPLGLDNGDLGTIERIAGLGPWKSLAVKVDGGKTVDVPLGKYNDVRLGYAMTTHKAQGATVRNAYVLLGGRMQDRHLSYVQASRAVENTRFFADRYEAGPELTTIARAMARSQAKEMAHDILDPVRPRPDHRPAHEPARHQ